MSNLEFLWHVKALNKKYILCISVLALVLERFIWTWNCVVQSFIYSFIYWRRCAWPTKGWVVAHDIFCVIV